MLDNHSISPREGATLSGEHVERRLAAILAADVAGSCRLIGIDEEGTLAQLKALRRTLFDPKVIEHRGRVVKNTGDGALVEFGSIVDAVRCAVEIQRCIAEENIGVLKAKQIELRIGIHVGDIIIDENDIFGDGVNIAVRLEGIAEPGGVCISDDAYRQVRGKVDIAFEDLGAQKLKNIAEPMCVWRSDTRFSSLDLSSTEATRPSARSEKPSMVVLPFQNMSGDPEQDHFADGMVEDIVTALSRFRWFNVVSRTSSFAQKGRTIDVRQVARELAVRFVLEGSVRKSGQRVRVTAQLIDGELGTHIWGERYDRDYTDYFDLQDQVTRDIVASLEYVFWTILVRGGGGTEHARSPLRAAGWHIAEFTHKDNLLAIASARSALQSNPKSIAANQYLVNAYIAELFTGWTDDAEADVKNLFEAGRRAVALNPGDSLSQGLWGCALSFAQNYDEALGCVERALSLNNNSVNVLGPCGNVLSFAGKAQEANEMFERMVRLAPNHYCRAAFLSQMALNWYVLGEPSRGLSLAKEAVRLKPDALCCHIAGLAILHALDRFDDAAEAVSEVYRRRPDFDASRLRLMFPHRDRAIPDHFSKLLGERI